MNTKENLIKKSLPRLKSLLESCRLCPRNCSVNRLENKKGFCNAGLKPAVYSYAPHHGEEPPLSGIRGSGTIFFTHCNMACVYCQNYKFSQQISENEITTDELANLMLSLERLGCHNINLVSPTHYIPQIVEALSIALEKGLKVPLVYNTGGYDSVEVIKLLDGIVDIYMPDMRYSDDAMAEKYSNAPNYVKHNRISVLEMQRQRGDLNQDRKGIAIQGLIIRCLVLPENISGTEETLEFISTRVSKKTYTSLMSQYYPAHKARDISGISRRLTADEYSVAVDKMKELGLMNGWVQSPPYGMDLRLAGHKIKPR